MKHATAKILVLILSTLLPIKLAQAGPPPTVDDVGDADSFGANAHFMGAQSGFITIQTAAVRSITYTNTLNESVERHSMLPSHGYFGNDPV